MLVHDLAFTTFSQVHDPKAEGMKTVICKAPQWKKVKG